MDVKRILITGSGGFIGRNLVERLGRDPGIEIAAFDVQNSSSALQAALRTADFVFHLAGINRPKDDREFESGNVDLTRQIVEILREHSRQVPVVFASSIQAALDNPYGRSKKRAEEALFSYAEKTGAPVYIYRFPNVFGKWCRPNYNSVVATFCHNVARGLPITISDERNELELIYIDDVIAAFDSIVHQKIPEMSKGFCLAQPTYRITLGRLAALIRAFHDSRKTLTVPDFSSPLVSYLYATFLSYLPEDKFAYPLKQHQDERGELAELLKSPGFGQIFVSRTRPGVVRGNHWHDTKVEKFVVLEGEGLIRFRHIQREKVIEYPVSGKEFRVVDIPPGYTHSIDNRGSEDLIVLFWANQIFDPEHPDTYFAEVQ